jgi:hypothetical protein
MLKWICRASSSSVFDNLGQVVGENPFGNWISREKLLSELHNVRDVKNCLRFTLKFFSNYTAKCFWCFAHSQWILGLAGVLKAPETHFTIVAQTTKRFLSLLVIWFPIEVDRSEFCVLVAAPRIANRRLLTHIKINFRVLSRETRWKLTSGKPSKGEKSINLYQSTEKRDM